MSNQNQEPRPNQRQVQLPHPRLFLKDAEMHRDLANAYETIAQLQQQLGGAQQEIELLKEELAKVAATPDEAADQPPD